MQQDGTIRVYAVTKNSPSNYSVSAEQDITSIFNIPNHNDDGSLAPSVSGRTVTGLLVVGTATNPVIYVSSSDPRVSDPNSSFLNGDTNSGIISRLTWNGSSWVKLDLVRGLPRSSNDHVPNGLQLNAATNTLYLAVAGNTNMGAPSHNFHFLPEYALSGAILSINLTQIGNTSGGGFAIPGNINIFAGSGVDNVSLTNITTPAGAITFDGTLGAEHGWIGPIGFKGGLECGIGHAASRDSGSEMNDVCH